METLVPISISILGIATIELNQIDNNNAWGMAF